MPIFAKKNARYDLPARRRAVTRFFSRAERVGQSPTPTLYVSKIGLITDRRHRPTRPSGIFCFYYFRKVASRPRMTTPVESNATAGSGGPFLLVVLTRGAHYIPYHPKLDFEEACPRTSNSISMRC